jgi:hypothetical protein
MIHHIQHFEFETDSLKDFERMLETIVHIEFRYPNSEYTKLHMKNKPPSFWNDGSDYQWTQKAIIEVNQKIYSIEPCATFHGAKQYKTLNQYVSLEEAAKDTNHCKRVPATRLWVATLSDSACGFKKGEDHYCQSKSQIINHASTAMQHAATKTEEFAKLRVPEWMDRGDGSIGMGFRMSHEWEAGSEVLYLSLCHVYYGK